MRILSNHRTGTFQTVAPITYGQRLARFLRIKRTEKPPSLYYEDIQVGDLRVMPNIRLTRWRRKLHTLIYGEDWPVEELPKVKEKGLWPSPQLLSYLDGQMGQMQWLRIRAGGGYEASARYAVSNCEANSTDEAGDHYPVHFLHKLFVGDTVRAVWTVIDKKLKPGAKDGFVFVNEQVYNQHDVLCYERIGISYVLPFKQKSDSI